MLKKVKEKQKMKTTTHKIVMSALIAALTCVATMIIRLPSPLGGYINLGDAVVLVAAFMLPRGYMFYKRPNRNYCFRNFQVNV